MTFGKRLLTWLPRAALTTLMMVAIPASAELDVQSVWARATPPGMPMGAVYAELKNNGSDAIEVVRLETPVARAAEIHESIEIDGKMRMREITPFIVPAGKAVSLAPGGKHMMLMGLKSDLASGQRFPIELHLSDGAVLKLEALVGGFGQMSMPE